MNRELSIEERRAAFSVVIYSLLLQENMDKLKATTLWKRNLKKVGTMLINIITSLLKQNDAVYQANPTIYANVMRDNNDLVQKIIKCNAKDLAMINQMHDLYKEKPDQWDYFYKYHQLNKD